MIDCFHEWHFLTTACTIWHLLEPDSSTSQMNLRTRGHSFNLPRFHFDLTKKVDHRVCRCEYNLSYFLIINKIPPIFATYSAVNKISQILLHLCGSFPLSYRCALYSLNTVSHNYKVNYNTLKTYHINSYIVNMTITHRCSTLHHVITSASCSNVVAPSGEWICIAASRKNENA